MIQQRFPIGAEISANVGRILDQAKVPNVLFGRQAMLFSAHPTAYGDLTFVVRDDQIDDAKHALDDQNLYRLCTDPNCMELMENRTAHEDFDWGPGLARLHPIADHHFHTKVKMIIIYLVRQSDHLWWLPPLTLDIPDEHHPYLTVSTDPDLPARREVDKAEEDLDEDEWEWEWEWERVGPCGPWVGLYPVRILQPGRFIEAVCWLWMRDCRPSIGNMWWLWHPMLQELENQWKEMEGSPGGSGSPWQTMFGDTQERWNQVEGTPARSGRLWQIEEDFLRAFRWFAGDLPSSVQRCTEYGLPFPNHVALLRLRGRLNEQHRFETKLAVEELPEYELKLTGEEKRKFPWFHFGARIQCAIGPEDRRQAYTFPALALAARGPWPLFRFSFLAEYLNQEDFADCALPQMASNEISQRLAVARRQITGDCAGLLVVDDEDQNDLTFRSSVSFAHPSVGEFLANKSLFFRTMATSFAGSFDPFHALCQTLRAHNKAAGLALAGYTSATIWDFAHGVPSFEFDVYTLLELSTSQPLQFDFDGFIGKAIDDICGIHRAEDATFERCFTIGARNPPKLNLREMLALMSGLYGCQVDIPGLSPERARLCVAALCDNLRTPQLGPASRVLPLLERQLRKFDVSPNEPYPLQLLLNVPDHTFSDWHCAFVSALRRRLYKPGSADFRLCVAFFILMGADLRVSVSLVPENDGTTMLHLHHTRDQPSILELRFWIPTVILPAPFTRCKELSFEVLVKQMCPGEYRYLTGAIQLVLRHDGPPTAEVREKVERHFGDSVRKAIAPAETKQ
ncbi:hypothetical protein BJY00DRAFT_306826 [Aspergillus carlsbadensis]|nr:hypothetical protein BJY00DRAFT_306826 [Aspergillus carlsbadensis]